LVLRTTFLDRIPSGISNDELDYILNAKSIYLTGSDISQTWNPLSLTPPKSSFPQAEIPSLLTFWFIGPLSLSLSTSKLIYTCISLGIVYLLHKITQSLLGKRQALFVSFVAAVNPWLIFFGRTAYDVSIAVFFYLLGLYIFLYFRKWKITLAFPALFAAFYSYVGTKLILLPFVVITIGYSWSIHKRYVKQYALVLILCITLVLIYSLDIFRSTESRTNELISINNPVFSEQVNEERRLSVKTPLTPIFSNKYIIFIKYAVERYLNIFSPNFLFLHGDGKSLFSVWQHGSFYYIEAFFFMLGLAALFSKNKRVLFFLSLLLIITPIPSIASNTGSSYAVRSLLFTPFFIILVGYGLWYAVENYPKLRLAILCLYVVSLFNFINIYFLRNPIYNSESFSFSSRVLAKYLSLTSERTYVINGTARTPYKQYLFYNNWITKDTVNKIAQDYKNNTYTIRNISFITCEQATGIDPNSTIIYDSCKEIATSDSDKTIAQLGDGGEIFTIYNDKLCNTYRLKRYPSEITFTDLNVDTLSTQRLCEKFITGYNLGD
jgi:hypothetical protein